MQSDPLWSCAMAVNVYLVFFRRYDAARLKKLYWYYGIMCYGLPFIPAMFCLFYQTREKGRMYGNATVCVSDPYYAKLTIIALVLDQNRMGSSTHLLILRTDLASHPRDIHYLCASWRRDIPEAI